ncbi:MAG TPA: hypothetical protein VGK24_08185 [Candidatus Angelobacter sp.]
MIVREFVVAEGREGDFKRIFEPEGIWSELLRRSAEYLGTDCRLEAEAERRYRVLDYWLSHESFEDFRQRHQLEYEKFSRLIASEGLVERETLLGSFYRGESDFDEGIDLVPS